MIQYLHEEISNSNKYPNSGLPVVSEQTIDAIYHVYAGKKWGKHLDKVKQHLIKENPKLVQFIERQVAKHPRELHNALFEITVEALAVIELQLQANTTLKR